jgi:hypothetical protein
LKRLPLVFFILFVLLCGPSSAQDPADNQLWSDVQIAVPVTKTIDFNVIGGLRLGRDINHAVDERIGAGFTFKFRNYLTVAPNYLYIGTQPFKGRRAWESRLSLPVTVRFGVGRFRLSDRHLFERRFRNARATSTRYRNRFQVEHPIGPKKLSLSLFAADEVFYDWSVNRWVRNRFIAGASKVFNKHFTQDFYYLRQNDGVTRPGDLNVLGTTLRLRL